MKWLLTPFWRCRRTRGFLSSMLFMKAARSSCPMKKASLAKWYLILEQPVAKMILAIPGYLWLPKLVSIEWWKKTLLYTKIIFICCFSGKEWLKGLKLGVQVAENDINLVQNLWNRLRSAVSPSSSFNITLNLDTNQVRGFLFKARARLIWPKMTPSSLDKLVFPLTQVGNSSVKEV